jgi:hypothetical protein
MPELYSSRPSSPQINLLYLAPGQEIISPEQFRASDPEILATGAGTQLAKMSPSMLVKYGTHASLIEAKNMLYVAERTSIPVPRLFAAYAYGPLNRDVDDFGSVLRYIYLHGVRRRRRPGKVMGKMHFYREADDLDRPEEAYDRASLSSGNWLHRIRAWGICHWYHIGMVYNF